MLLKWIRSGWIWIFIIFIAVPAVEGQSKFPETISVLRALYNGEVQAKLNYLGYAQKANSENYPNIAHLFTALATSELIHARNFKRLLTELGVEVKETLTPEVKVSSTKQNLKRATEVELQEIDQKYPQYIERIKPEHFEAAIQFITYAWEAEKQHRDLILKIQSGTGLLFGILARTMEKTPSQFFVCQNCGSTLIELPKDVCPICKGPLSQYEMVKKIE